jgi:plasmid stability protein
MASISLQIVAEQCTPALAARVQELWHSFDAVQIASTADRPGWQSLADRSPPGCPVQVVDSPWPEGVAGARNDLWAGSSTDYVTWLDAEDDLIGANAVRSLVHDMQKDHIDVLFAPFDQDGPQGAVGEREYVGRILRTGLAGAWAGEGPGAFAPSAWVTTRTTDRVVCRRGPGAAATAQSDRAALEAAYRDPQRAPEVAYRLGCAYLADGRHRQALDVFAVVTTASRPAQEMCRAWLKASSCHLELGEIVMAGVAAERARALVPEEPDAYFALQRIHHQLRAHDTALRWFALGRSKLRTEPDAAIGSDARRRDPWRLAAESYLAIGQPLTALELTVRAGRHQGGVDAEGRQLLLEKIVEQVRLQEAVASAKTLVTTVRQLGGDPAKLLEALPGSLRDDARLAEVLDRRDRGRRWPRGSVVFSCGRACEVWGPDRLGDGVGGSEEAVIYLARELAAQGRPVTVFNERRAECRDWRAGSPHGLAGVRYRPWFELDLNDEFDVFVAWRSPSTLKDVSARLRLCDLHDIVQASTVYDNMKHVDKYLFKSRFHRDLYPELPDSKALVIGNGIRKDHFDE